MKRAIAIILAALTLLATADGQQTSRTVAERLGYPRDAKLLIVHADDLGMTHSVNIATIKALHSGLVNSASIMVPCPQIAELAAYARANPQTDLGIHLTLTSEWTNYRWGPVSEKGRVSSLLDKDGYFYRNSIDADAHADPKQVEMEINAQIERARALGIHPTHLDSHMGMLYQNKILLGVLTRVARREKLPVGVARSDVPPELRMPGDVYVDRVLQIDPSVAPEDWESFYSNALRKLAPGVTEMLVHVAYDDTEMQGVTFDHPDWGAAWRQRDLTFFTSNTFSKILQENQIYLITWRELGKLIA
jgi:chitin disaccharide deacetylase